MDKNKVILKNSIVLYIRLAIVSVIGLFVSRYTLNALGVSDYGLYSVVASIVFLMAFLNNIMVTTTYRFIAYEEGAGDKDSVNRVFNISLVIHILIAFSVLLIAETFGVFYINNYLTVDPQKLNEALFVFRVSIYTTIISILGVPYQGLLVAKEKFIISSFIEITRSLLQLGAVFLVLYYSGSKLKLYSLLIGITSMVPPVLFFLYTRYKYNAIVRWSFQKNRSIYKEMAFFSGWTMLGAAAVASELQFSILLINMFFGTIVNAGFAVAVSVNSIVRTFSQSLNQSVIPQITKSYSAGDTKRTMDLVVFTSKYSFFLILFPSIPILLETDVILKLWLNNVPLGTSLFVKFFILNAIISSIYAGIPAIIQATGKIKYFQIILSSLSLIGIPISYLLFKNGYPPYTLSMVYLIISVINFIVLQFLLKWILDFNINEMFKRVYLKMGIMGISILPLFFIQFFFNQSYFRFILVAMVSILWIIAVIYLFGMSKKEKEKVNLTFKSFIILLKRIYFQIFLKEFK